MPAYLFTDLESSTRLWEQQPAEMGVALARHDRILRDAVEGASGRIVKTTGDGVFAVFDSVADAVMATIAAQISLADEPWATSAPLRVRMGIHFGESENRDGDYFGPSLNRAARIMAAGHGGQVLLSAVAADLVAGSLPEGTGLRNLGTHRLKDLSQPEHLYQLLDDQLQTEFPALVTLDARPNNLPTVVSEFFGRESELATIQLMLSASTTRLLTLTGPGGAGKTRLALQVAAEQLDHFEDGVFFVDLSPETDPDSAFEAVVRTLGYPVSGRGGPLDMLKGRLQDRHMLLVLDNFEQVTAAAAGLVDLIQYCPDLKVLVTSREALRVRAEQVYPVPALSLPNPDGPVDAISQAEAVRLFVDRARSVRPEFALNEANASIIAEICLRLDGLPLAIELAAARLNVFAPRELMERLRQRLDILGAGGRDLPDRQRTLWGAIGWSYELLDPEERLLFEMMAVFSPTGLAALEHVANSAIDGGFSLDSLASLVDKNLVRSIDSNGLQHFSMLHTIEEYAAERLANSPEFEMKVRDAHAVYFSAHAQQLAGRLRGPERDAALEDLALGIGNLRTAWRYWVDRGDAEQILTLIDPLWALHDAKGWYHAAIELAHDALGVITSAGGSSRSVEELTLRTSLARALMAVQGYTVEVERAFRDVLDLAAVAGEATQLFPVLRALATYYMGISDFEKAAELGQRLLDLADQEDDDSIRIDGHYVFGAATAFAGDIETGLTHLDRVIEMFDPRIHSAGDFRLGPSPGVVARVASGFLLWQGGSLDAAVARVDEALALARELAHPFSLAYALYHNGLLHIYRTRFEDAAERARELRQVAGENDYPIWTTLASVLEGVSMTGMGRVEEGLSLTEAGVKLYRGLSTPPIFWPLILGLRAQVFAAAGDPQRGLELIEEAIERSAATGVGAAEHRVVRGDILQALGHNSAADENYQEAAREARSAGIRLVELQATTRLVELRKVTGAVPDGTDDLRRLLAKFVDGLDENVMRAAVGALEHAPGSAPAPGSH